MLTLKHLGTLERDNPLLGETLRSMQAAINQHGIIAGIDPTGTFPTPAAPSQIQVTQVAGGLDVAIVDANPQRGVYYYVETSLNAGFAAPRSYFLGTVRNIYLPVVAGTYFVRCYAQFQGSNPSPYTVFGGTTPQSVTGGAAGTPVLVATQGTGSGGPTGGSPNPPVGGGFGPLGDQPSPRNLPGGRFQLNQQ